MNTLQYVFFGSDEFSIEVLKTIIESGQKPLAIITVPPKPVGRKKIITPPPITFFAEENGINVIYAENLSDDSFINTYNNLGAEIAVVASFGKIIPETVLNIPKYKTFNVHPSLLPKWRGATPIEHTILNDDIAGVTIIRLDNKMDHGEIALQEEFSLDNPDNEPMLYNELRDKLSNIGGKLILSLFSNIKNESIKLTPQRHSDATYTKKLSKQDGEIILTHGPKENLRKIRAFSNWPGTYFTITKNGKKLRVIIKKAHIEDGLLKIDTVIPEGKSEMDFASFERGYLN